MTSRMKSLVSVALLLIATVPLRAAWTTQRLTNDSGASFEPAIAIDGLNVYVVWSNETPGRRNIYFKKSSSGGATWEAVHRLTENSPGSRNPKIAVGGSSVYVVWEDHTQGHEGIYFRRSLNRGAAWQSARRIAISLEFAWRPAIAVSGSNIYIAWSDLAPADYEIYFRKSVDGGSTWQGTKRLTDGAKVSNGPALAVSGSTVYVAWAGGSATVRQDTYFRKSLDGGATWRTVHQFPENKGLSMNPTIAAAGSNVYLAWHHHDSGSDNDEVYFTKSSNRGATWQNTQRLTKNSGSSSAAVLAVSGSNIYITWFDDTPGNWEVYFRKSADRGANWAGALRLTTNSGKSQIPAIAAGASNVYVVWQDDTPGNFEIFLATMRPPIY